MGAYEYHELRRVAESATEAEPTYRLKVTSDTAETRWLNIDQFQMDVLTGLLGEGEK